MQTPTKHSIQIKKTREFQYFVKRINSSLPQRLLHLLSDENEEKSQKKEVHIGLPLALMSIWFSSRRHKYHSAKSAVAHHGTDSRHATTQHQIRYKDAEYKRGRDAKTRKAPAPQRVYCRIPLN